MAEAQQVTGLNTRTGRILVFVYGVLAFAASGRASFELATKFDKAPVPYGFSVAAALIYIVATWALATNRWRVAVLAVGFELCGVLGVGFSSLLWTSGFPKASVWSDFGSGYGYVPLVLPLIGMWWLFRNRPQPVATP